MAIIRIHQRKPMTVAYVEHTGGFNQIPFTRDYRRLYAWARRHKVRPGVRPLAIFLDDPSVTPPERLRARVAIVVHGVAVPDDEVHVETLPSGEVASTRMRGTAREFPKVYAELGEWMQEHGYEWAGPSMEVYNRRPKGEGVEMVLDVRIQVPVRQRPRPAT